MPKSGEQDDQTAPMLVAASMAMDRFRDVGHEAGHPVSLDHPEIPQGLGHSGGPVVQFGVGSA